MQSGPMRTHRRERFVFGGLNTAPMPGIVCNVLSMVIVPAVRSMSDQRRAHISPRRAPISKASCVMTLYCVGASCRAAKRRAMSFSSSACMSTSAALGDSARLQGLSAISPHCTALEKTLDNMR